MSGRNLRNVGSVMSIAATATTSAELGPAVNRPGFPGGSKA
jgi:hypothetical protein